MRRIGKWLFTAVITCSLVGTVNVWTTEDLKEFKGNWQDYPHWPTSGQVAPSKPADDGGSRYSGDFYRNELKVGEEILLVEKSVPEFGSMGEDFVVDLNVTALEDAGNIIVKTSVPDGATYVKSDPNGKLVGDEVVWEFDKMMEGETKNLKAYFRPSGEGDYSSCTVAHAWPMACVVTKIRMPRLSIEKDGPETANLGENVKYTITVHNEGTAPAEDVMITDYVPRGMLFDGSSEQVTLDLGTIAAGDSETVSLDLEAAERGYFCNRAQVNSSNANSASDEACTQVVEQGISITKSGPAETFVGKSATYNIRVTNTGDTELTNLSIRDNADRATDVESADGGSISGDSASWSIDKLGAGESRSFSVTINSKNAGTFCNEASVDSAQGVSDQDDACTLWKGHPAILMELVDVEDPLLVGENTTYKVRITNQGSALDSNITVNLMFPSQIQPLSASGDTAGSVSGRSVSFEPYGQLNPGQAIEFSVEAKATGKGDARIKLELDSDLLKKPVTEEESTHVY